MLTFSLHTCEVDGSPANFVRKRTEDNVPNQKASEEQGSSQAHFVGFMFNQKPLKSSRDHTEEEKQLHNL